MFLGERDHDWTYVLVKPFEGGPHAVVTKPFARFENAAALAAVLPQVDTRVKAAWTRRFGFEPPSGMPQYVLTHCPGISAELLQMRRWFDSHQDRLGVGIHRFSVHATHGMITVGDGDIQYPEQIIVRGSDNKWVL